MTYGLDRWGLNDDDDDEERNWTVKQEKQPQLEQIKKWNLLSQLGIPMVLLDLSDYLHNTNGGRAGIEHLGSKLNPRGSYGYEWQWTPVYLHLVGYPKNLSPKSKGHKPTYIRPDLTHYIPIQDST